LLQIRHFRKNSNRHSGENDKKNKIMAQKKIIINSTQNEIELRGVENNLRERVQNNSLGHCRLHYKKKRI